MTQSKPSRRASLVDRFSQAAPFVTLALLALFAWRLPNRNIYDPEAAVRMLAVKQSVDDLPRFIDGWAGIDDQGAIPPEAQKMLRPNAILSRSYRRPGGPDLQFLLVHCGDARDMIGHYPPVCYPSAGYQRMEIDGAPFVDEILKIDEETELPVRVYRFSRTRDGGREDRIRIFSAFVLPDGTVTRGIDDINEQAGRRAVTVEGVAQLQVVTQDRLDREEARAAAERLIAGMGDLLQSLRITRRSGP